MSENRIESLLNAMTVVEQMPRLPVGAALSWRLGRSGSPPVSPARKSPPEVDSTSRKPVLMARRREQP
jgi:hypothetical protein